jgi:hypothetical protein
MACYVVVRIVAACVEECGVNLRCPPRNLDSPGKATQHFE